MSDDDFRPALVSAAEFEARRNARGGDVGRCECGGEWFRLRLPNMEEGRITLSAAGGPTGYAGFPHCEDCGSRFTPRGGWVRR